VLFQDWLERESVRRRLTALGAGLSRVLADYEAVKASSSKTVGGRVEQTVEDYWRAVEAFGKDQFEAARQEIAAACLGAQFLDQLLRSEAVERELGEGNMFELSQNLDEKKAAARIEADLQQIGVELYSLLQDVRSVPDEE
jgi:hypothetical protein